MASRLLFLLSLFFFFFSFMYAASMNHSMEAFEVPTPESFVENGEIESYYCDPDTGVCTIVKRKKADIFELVIEDEEEKEGEEEEEERMQVKDVHPLSEKKLMPEDHAKISLGNH